MTEQQFDCPGEVLIGRYQIQQQLGKKAGRRTLLALDLETQEQVVIKLLLFGQDFQWDDLKLFKREVKTLQALFHPSIPRYLNHFELDTPNGKGFALVQTYIQAKSLEEHFKTGHVFVESEVKQIAKKLLKILTYLHECQPPVIHRDIKPSNILLTKGPNGGIRQIYLVDFGSVQTIAAQETGTITIVGTYGYMPPEQFGGRVVPASDLYSLGATLVYLLAGQHPADLPQTDLRVEFEPSVKASPVFVRWLRGMLEPSLNQRFTSAEEAIQVLEQGKNSLVPLSPRQPFGSKVCLNKRPDAIEIELPARRTVSGVPAQTLMMIARNLLIVPILAISTRVSASFLPLAVLKAAILGIAVIFFWIVGRIIFKAITDLFVRTHLQINHHEISLTYNLFGLKLTRSHTINSRDICKLVYNRHYRRRGNNETLPLIVIWAGTRKFELGEAVSEPELEWIASEIADWLGLPLSLA